MQCHVKHVKINRCRQLGIDGVVDTDVHGLYIKGWGLKFYMLRTVFFRSVPSLVYLFKI